MALENGAILMSRQIDLQAPIYINSNHFDTELIYTSTGNLEEGLNEHVSEIGTAIEAATEGLASKDIHGAIIYLHCNIPENEFNYKEILYISVFMGVSLVNGTLKDMTLEGLLQKLVKHKIFGDQSFL